MKPPPFIDTNIIIRYLTKEDPDKARACYALFKQAEENKITITTSESVIAEAVFVLASKKHYNLSPVEIKKRLTAILSLRGFKLEYRQTYLRALELYTTYTMDFEDCLSIAHMERQQLKNIYSYDQDFDRVTSVNRIEPGGKTPR